MGFLGFATVDPIVLLFSPSSLLLLPRSACLKNLICTVIVSLRLTLIGIGFIDKDEIKILEQCLFHDGHKYGNTKKAWKKALRNADANKDGLLDFEEFNTMLNNNPMMLYPAWQMQTHMMKQILGRKYCNRYTHLRKCKSFTNKIYILLRKMVERSSASTCS